MNTNCTAAVSALALTSLLATSPSAFALDAGDADLDATTLALIQQYDDALIPPDDRENAAVWYQQAIEELSRAQITTEEWMLEGSSPTDSATWDSRVAHSILSKSSCAIRLAREAARHPWADFGVDRSRGRNILLPHLTPMRRLSRLMAMQVRTLRAIGNDDAAHSLLIDICSLSQHAASERLPLASLAASACSLQAVQGIDEAIALGALSNEEARELRSTIDANDDPFHYAEAILGERDLIIPWLEQNPDAALAELNLARAINQDNHPANEPTDNESLHSAIEALDSGFNKVHEIMLIKDPARARAMLVDFEESLAEGSFGELGTHLLQNHARIVCVKLDVQKRISDVDNALREIELGADPITFANAATLYAYAFPHLEQLQHNDQDSLETLRRYTAVVGSTEGLPQETILHARKLIEQLAPARELVARATWCDMCSWAQAEDAERLSIVIGEGHWVRPMRALARMQLVQAILAHEDGRIADADIAIADALAISLHLADGSHMLANIVGSATLGEVADIAQVLQRSGSFAENSKTHSIFQRRLQRLDSRDPLAWRAGRDAMMRTQIIDHLTARFNIDSRTAARRLLRCNDERLASLGYLLVDDDPLVFEYRFERPSRNEAAVLFSLGDIVELDKNTCDRLRGARRHLDQVLMIIDDTSPIAAERWRTRGLEAFETIQDAVARTRPAQLATVPAIE